MSRKSCPMELWAPAPRLGNSDFSMARVELRPCRSTRSKASERQQKNNTRWSQMQRKVGQLFAESWWWYAPVNTTMASCQKIGSNLAQKHETVKKSQFPTSIHPILNDQSHRNLPTHSLSFTFPSFSQSVVFSNGTALTCTAQTHTALTGDQSICNRKKGRFGGLTCQHN